jgi:hypothetical protein
MSDREPERNNPLSPYFPSRVPSVPGNARRWFVVLMVALLFGGTVLSLVFSLLGGL